MPFRKEWRTLVVSADGRIDRRLYETAVLAHLRDNSVPVTSGSNVRRTTAASTATCCRRGRAGAAAELELPATADEWLEARGQELD